MFIANNNTVIIVIILLVFAPAVSGTLETFVKHDDATDEETDEFIGTTTVQITTYRQADVLMADKKTKSSSLPKRARGLLIDFTIPKTDHHARCEVVENLRLFIEDDTGDDDDNSTNPNNPLNDDDDDHCHYAGLASFDAFPYRTKCLISFCSGIKSGIVWLPGESAYLQLTIEDDNNANITKRGKVDHYSMLDPDPEGTKGRAFAMKTAENVHWAHRLLLDTVPPEWYHFRIMVIVTPDALKSDVLRGSRKLTIQVVSSVFNLVNVIWSQFNVTVYLKQVVIWTGNSTVDGLQLPPFPDTDWHIFPNPEILVLRPAIRIAKDQIWPKMTRTSAVDYIILIRNLNGQRGPNSNIIGLAYPDSVCQHKNSYGALLGVRTSHVRTVPETIIVLATVISHELGHAFGIENHDDPNKCKCPSSDRLCIMNPKVDSEFRRLIQWAWSDCSINVIESYLKHLARISPLCLREVPRAPAAFSNLTTSVCGNGILEEGEQCDCGPGTSHGGPPRHYFSTIFCDNPNCCDYNSCKLIGRAECANGPCCDSATCAFYDSYTICRDAVSECDIPDICPGNSSLCPRDRFYMTGTPCQNDTGTCHLGYCVSRKERCETLMGGLYEDNTTNSCFKLNEYGLFAANCGHRHYKPDHHYDENSHYDSIAKCSPENLECGSLMCTQIDKKRMEKEAVTPNSHYVSQKNITCYSIVGETLPDVGLTPDGMLCQNGKKYCHHQRCQFDVPKCDEPSPCDNLGHHVPNETRPLRTSRPVTKPIPHSTASECDQNYNLTVLLQSLFLIFSAILYS